MVAGGNIMKISIMMHGKEEPESRGLWHVLYSLVNSLSRFLACIFHAFFLFRIIGLVLCIRNS